MNLRVGWISLSHLDPLVHRRMNLYTAEDDAGSIIVDAETSYVRGDPWEERFLSSGELEG